jgi:hypothetical protein
MGFDSLEDAEDGLQQISNELYVQLKNCAPYTPTEEDYRLLREDPHGDLIDGNLPLGLKRASARALANRHGFIDENLMVIARDFIIEARSYAEDYCSRLEKMIEEETDSEFQGAAGAKRWLRTKRDLALKAEADKSIQKRIEEKKRSLHTEFDEDFGRLYGETLAFLRKVYDKGC